MTGVFEDGCVDNKFLLNENVYLCISKSKRQHYEEILMIMRLN